MLRRSPTGLEERSCRESRLRLLASGPPGVGSSSAFVCRAGSTRDPPAERNLQPAIRFVATVASAVAARRPRRLALRESRPRGRGRGRVGRLPRHAKTTVRHRSHRRGPEQGGEGPLPRHATPPSRSSPRPAGRSSSVSPIWPKPLEAAKAGGYDADPGLHLQGRPALARRRLDAVPHAPDVPGLHRRRAAEGRRLPHHGAGRRRAPKHRGAARSGAEAPPASAAQPAR